MSCNAVLARQEAMRGRAPPQSRSAGPPTRSSGPRHILPRNKGNGNEPLPGAGALGHNNSCNLLAVGVQGERRR